MYSFMYAVAWETSFTSNGREEIIINCYACGCVSLESIYFTAYKTLAFVDGRTIFRELISVVLLYCAHHQSKYLSEQEVLVMAETKILKGSLQLFFCKDHAVNTPGIGRQYQRSHEGRWLKGVR